MDNVDVVTMFDPPHLLKCFRNLFMKYDIRCATQINSYNESEVGVAKWSHIKEFFESDNQNQNFVFAPALKPEHLDPNSKQKMIIKLDAQVLSNTVAAGRMAKISAGQLTTEAAVTADVFERMDKIFDTLNSDLTDLRRGKIMATNLKDSTTHLKFINEMILFFISTYSYWLNRQIIEIGISIYWLALDWNAVEKIWKNSKSKHDDIKSLATRRL